MNGIAIALTASCGLTLWFTSGYSPLRIVDSPNARSLHESPTPRTGGIAILSGIALAWGYMAMSGLWPSEMNWIVVAAIIVAAISLLDDFVDLPPLPKFATHGLAAAVLVAGGLILPWGVAGIVITWLAVVWMLNLYNFMDGMDGFAGGMTVAGFGFLGLAGWMAGSETYALYCWIVSASALGFLCFNFPPARIFMGDAGSATLGLLAAGFSLWGIHDGLFSLWLPLLVFSPFIVDATITLIRRGLRGEKVWQAHRTHYYQRLVQAGWGHKKTVLTEYVLMLSAGLTAILLLLYPRWGIIGLISWCAIFILLAYMVEHQCIKPKEGMG